MWSETNKFVSVFAVKDDEEEDVDQMNSRNLLMLDRNTHHGPRDVLAIFFVNFVLYHKQFI